MPKKHAPSFTHTKPSYVHPSLQSSRASSSAGTTEPQTVNQRIQQLRKEQAPRTTPERRNEITDVITQRTVPPALRKILNMTEVDAPRPKAGLRSRRVPQQGPRPPPGPATPSSWLLSSRHAPNSLRKPKANYVGGDGTTFCALAMEHDREYQRIPQSWSLVHHCLRTLALHWDELAEYEQHYLPTLPIHHKEALLSYLSRYGGKGCMGFKSFKILFQNEKEVEGASGSEDVRFLDLTGLLNKNYTLADLNKSLNRSFRNGAVTSSLAELSLDFQKRKRIESAPMEIADSWDDDEADNDNFEHTMNALPSQINIPVFPNLTRLSLAHSGQWASWSDLLTVSTKLNTLTHLSLAYWPRPSTTPNAATTSMISKHTKPISLGGSHFYSDLDDDWHEAANVLRRLSLNTYCLKWLDLEGCTWHKALTWDFPQPDRIGGRGVRTGEDGWTQTHTFPGPDWSAAWRQIEYLNLFQGWIPSDRASLQIMPGGAVQVQLMGWLRENEENEDVKNKLSKETGSAVGEWVEREKIARSVAYEVQQRRKKSEGSAWCTVDYGWEAKVPARKKVTMVGGMDGPVAVQ